MVKKSYDLVLPANEAMAKGGFASTVKSSLKKSPSNVRKKVKFSLTPINCQLKETKTTMSEKAFHKIKSGILNSPIIFSTEKKEKIHKPTIKDLLIID